MNFSGFKKVHDDKDKAILRNGPHSITISKGALSPKHRSGLEKLPLYASDGPDTAEAGDDSSMNGADPVPQSGGSPIVINVGGQPTAPPPAPAPQAAAAPQQGLAPQAPGGDAPAAQPEAPAMPDRALAAQAPMPEQNPAIAGATAGGVEGAMPEMTPKQEAVQQYTAEDQAFQNDLNNGHITPKTYSDLFHEKGTLGKIGTLFGLMLSGAGSGLTHQPNVLLEMMNKQIANDLEGQKASKANAQNFLRLNLEHQKQQGELAKMGAETGLIHAEAGQKAFALAQMQMNRAAFHSLVQSVQKLPPGSPQRQQAEQTLGVMYQAINNENFNIADRAAAASSLGNFGTQAGGGSPGEAAFQKRDRMLRLSGNDKLADDMEGKHMPGFSGQSSQPIPQEIRAQLTAQKQYDEKAREYVEFAKKHQANWANLDLVDRQRIQNQGAAMAANLQSLYRNKIKGGVYKKGEQEFIQQIIPDQPAKWSASFNAIPKVEQTIHDNTNDMSTTARGVGLSVGKGEAPKAVKKEAPKEKSSGPAEGATGSYTDEKGNKVPVVYRGGKWGRK